jgi:hypothetical protein
MKKLWADAGVQDCVSKGSEATIPEKYVSRANDPLIGELTCFLGFPA